MLEDKIYRKKVDSKIHKLRLMDAYGIDEEIIEELKKAKCNSIRILETDTNTVLSIPFPVFMKNSVKRKFDGTQFFVSVKFFNKETYKK